MPEAILSFLQQDGSTSFFGGVTFELEGLVDVRLDKDGGFTKFGLEEDKGAIFWFIPVPFGCLFGQIVKRSG